jgi:hypothetical protein
LSLRQRVYRQTEANEGQRRELMHWKTDADLITHFLIPRKFEIQLSNLEFSQVGPVGISIVP